MFSFRHQHRNKADGLQAAAANFSGAGYSASYGATVQPSPGAMAYAYETLGLVAFPPSGPSIATRTPINPTATPLYVLQSIPMVSFGGTVSGQMVAQPLFNPYGGGYSGPSPVQHLFAPNLVDPTNIQP